MKKCGNLLEPDSWNPNFSPHTTLDAIGKLANIGFSDASHPIMQGLFRFFDSGVHSNPNGWLFSIPSNDDYPHAPWWTYDAKANQYKQIGVTAKVECFVLQFGVEDSALYKRCVETASC